MSETHGQWCTVRDIIHKVRAEPLDHRTRSAGIETGEACQRTSRSPQALAPFTGGRFIAGSWQTPHPPSALCLCPSALCFPCGAPLLCSIPPQHVLSLARLSPLSSRSAFPAACCSLPLCLLPLSAPPRAPIVTILRCCHATPPLPCCRGSRCMPLPRTPSAAPCTSHWQTDTCPACSPCCPLEHSATSRTLEVRIPRRCAASHSPSPAGGLVGNCGLWGGTTSRGGVLQIRPSAPGFPPGHCPRAKGLGSGNDALERLTTVGGAPHTQRMEHRAQPMTVPWHPLKDQRCHIAPRHRTVQRWGSARNSPRLRTLTCRTQYSCAARRARPPGLCSPFWSREWHGSAPSGSRSVLFGRRPVCRATQTVWHGRCCWCRRRRSRHQPQQPVAQRRPCGGRTAGTGPAGTAWSTGRGRRCNRRGSERHTTSHTRRVWGWGSPCKGLGSPFKGLSAGGCGGRRPGSGGASDGFLFFRSRVDQPMGTPTQSVYTRLEGGGSVGPSKAPPVWGTP